MNISDLNLKKEWNAGKKQMMLANSLGTLWTWQTLTILWKTQRANGELQSCGISVVRMQAQAHAGVITKDNSPNKQLPKIYPVGLILDTTAWAFL